MGLVSAIANINTILDLSKSRTADIVGIIEPFKALFKSGDKKAQIAALDALRIQSARKLAADLTYMSQRADITAASVTGMLTAIKDTGTNPDGSIPQGTVDHLLTLQQIANDLASSRGAIARMMATVNELDDESISLSSEGQ